jgi:DNA invertase Pin-like site-specific DNA recombinase
MKIGYARVSSKTQDHEAQVEQLKVAGCQRIVAEKASGKSITGRPQFERLLKALQPGDTVVVVKLDRLARSSRDLYNILHELAEKDCGFVSLGEAWCDTTTDVGRLLIAVMSGVSEFERSLIRKRCDEGIKRAQAKGTQFGRKPKLDAGQRRKIAERYAAGETMAELAREYDVSEPTIWRTMQ